MGWLRPACGDRAGPPARLETLEQPRAVELESLGAGEPNSLSYGVVELYLVYRATWTQGSEFASFGQNKKVGGNKYYNERLNKFNC